MRAVGETEFANGVAAMCASGAYGPIRACAGIVGAADLRLGEAVGPVLDAHLKAGGDRFRGMLLSRGGSVDAMELFKAFYGGDPDIQPLLERRGLTAQ